MISQIIAMMRRRIMSRGVASSILILASMVIAATAPAQLGTSKSNDEFRDIVESVDGSRIMSTVTDLQDFGSRAFDSQSMWNASIYIHDRFAELGLWVTYQEFEVQGYPQRNVVAVLNGTDPAAPQYLFGAHYDSITMDILLGTGLDYAPGADDDASGVAATIELATALHDMEFNSTVKFVAFGAEETGLNGSFTFVGRELENGTLYADTAIMDMIGYRVASQNRAFIFRGSSDNTLSASIHDAVYRYGLNLSLTFISGTEFAYSDHYAFWVAGYPSLMVIEELEDDWPANPHYHTENDTVDHISQEQMEVVTKAILGGFLDLQGSPKKNSDDSGALFLVITVVIVITAVAVTVYVYRNRKDVT